MYAIKRRFGLCFFLLSVFRWYILSHLQVTILSSCGYVTRVLMTLSQSRIIFPPFLTHAVFFVPVLHPLSPYFAKDSLYRFHMNVSFFFPPGSSGLIPLLFRPLRLYHILRRTSPEDKWTCFTKKSFRKLKHNIERWRHISLSWISCESSVLNNQQRIPHHLWHRVGIAHGPESSHHRAFRAP